MRGVGPFLPSRVVLTFSFLVFFLLLLIAYPKAYIECKCVSRNQIIEVVEQEP